MMDPNKTKLTQHGKNVLVIFFLLKYYKFNFLG